MNGSGNCDIMQNQPKSEIQISIFFQICVTYMHVYNIAHVHAHTYTLTTEKAKALKWEGKCMKMDEKN